jgi:hypothetical protein
MDVQSDQNKRNSVLSVVLFFFLIVSALACVYFIYKYIAALHGQSVATLQKTQNTPTPNYFPYLNIENLASAKVGAEYSAPIFATISGDKENLTIDATNLPGGLTLEDCIQQFNIDTSPTPNSQTECFIKGVPTNAGIYYLKITATNTYTNGYNTFEKDTNLTVNAP